MSVTSQQSQEEFTSVSLHPSGMFLAVAHITGFKVFSILVEKLYPMREIHLIFCTLVRYTRRGRYLLTNVKNQVLVYETIDYRLIYCFRKHPCLIRQFLFVEDTREVISSSDAQDLFLWRVVDSECKSSPYAQSGAVVYGHNSHELYSDFDYCAKLDLFLGATDSHSLVLYGDKCQVHLANFSSTNFNVSCLKIDRGSETILTGTKQGNLMLFSLVYMIHFLRQRFQSQENLKMSKIKILERLCMALGFFNEAGEDQTVKLGVNSIVQATPSISQRFANLNQVGQS